MDKVRGKRFKLVEFVNPSGGIAWRVSGYKRTGERVRENFTQIDDARGRATELEIEWLGGDVPSIPKVTRLTHAQLATAERAFDRLGDDGDLLSAVEFFIAAGRPRPGVDVPRLDEAVEAFESWLEQTPAIRPKTKREMMISARVFRRHAGNPRLANITTDGIEQILGRLNVAPASKGCYRRRWNRLFNWFIERPRRWITHNPVAEVRVEQGEIASPKILSLDQSRRVMAAAETVANGRMVVWFALGLFGGLRPTEASRITWGQINLDDGQIRLEGSMTKTRRPRVVSICPTLRAWLEAYRSGPVAWTQRMFRAVIVAAGIGEWSQDILRHTAATYRLRQLGSYAQVADELGNSETILRKHYNGRCSSKDTEAFYNIRPAGL